MFNNSRNIKFTKEGILKIEKEKEELLVRRTGVVERLARAREMGDLSENGAYKACKHELYEIDRKIRQIDYLRKNAVIGQTSQIGLIGIGSKVKVNNGKEIIEYAIVGDFEAEPLLGKVSGNCPIGAALIGRRKGDSVIIKIPVGEVTYKIIEVI